MKETKKSSIVPALKMFLIFMIICGAVYTLVVTGLAQLLFPKQANGSIIEVNGKKYGSELLGQYYTDEGHMWGRIMNLDVSTFKNEDGETLMYASPSNLSPASDEYKELVKERVDMLKKANPDMDESKIPVDLVTCSGSGLDPHISPAAAEYQVSRIAKVQGMSEEEVRDIIGKCTDGKLFGVLGEKTVNVLEVNLMLDGILE
ncbi:MAG: potassium-transporting ATPase subunit KdpC [Lachnospiraceae bacterium]|nr:potassium-transporting ATPase subunit KdpC [Lachnospiraceae bacterium]MDD7379612.1 potassium-transporting ATPase subunit KdpC [Lachnospiraceae bacterium]MDY4617846.1 potassium-transporting ATPase subunit KdpC [Lachnospiraceae bacterium]